MIGKNLIVLIGYITKPNLLEYEEGKYLFTATMSIPTDEAEKHKQKLKITSFEYAEQLALINEDVMVKVEGHFETKSYSYMCPSCGNLERRYWTTIVVDNFLKAEQEM